VWLINQDVEPLLQAMAFPAASGSAVFPAYLPPGGLSDSPYGRLMGRPVLPLEACQTVGTEGDIILTDPTQYLVVMKASGIRSDVSIHLYFDSDHVAFRFIMRVGGQPYWPAAITRQNGSNTLSSIVTLNSTRT
jgi:HK97 family phage major capsid protein